jgi:hypothetical protein
MDPKGVLQLWRKPTLNNNNNNNTETLRKHSNIRTEQPASVLHHPAVPPFDMNIAQHATDGVIRQLVQYAYSRYAGSHIWPPFRVE